MPGLLAATLATTLATALSTTLATPAQAAPTAHELFTSAVALDNWTNERAWAAYNGRFVPGELAVNIDRYADVQGDLACTAADCTGSWGNTANAGAGEATSASSTAALQTRGSAQATAWADLATARLGAAASGDDRPSIHGVLEGVFGTAKARMADTLRLEVDGATAQTTTRVGLRFEIDGSFAAGSGGSVRYWFTLGPGLAFGSQQEGSSPFLGTGSNGLFAPGSGFTVNTSGHVVYDALVDITGPQAELGVAMDLWAFGGLNGSTDWAHTGSITLQLPAQVRLASSGSGVFLSAAPVPEPGIWALLLAGLVTLGRLARRQAGERARAR